MSRVCICHQLLSHHSVTDTQTNALAVLLNSLELLPEADRWYPGNLLLLESGACSL
jgi:hypothetical protein